MKDGWRFPPEVSAVLAESPTVREVVRICQQEGPLDQALDDLLNHLRVAVRRNSALLRAWLAPDVGNKDGWLYLKVMPNSCWQKGTASVAISFWCINPTNMDWDDPPYVAVYVPSEFPGAAELRALLRRGIPAGFTDQCPGDDPDERTPFWKYLPFQDFAPSGEFDADAYVSAVLLTMEQAAAVRPIIDKFVASR